MGMGEDRRTLQRGLINNSDLSVAEPVKRICARDLFPEWLTDKQLQKQRKDHVLKQFSRREVQALPSVSKSCFHLIAVRRKWLISSRWLTRRDTRRPPSLAGQQPANRVSVRYVKAKILAACVTNLDAFKRVQVFLFSRIAYCCRFILAARRSFQSTLFRRWLFRLLALVSSI